MLIRSTASAPPSSRMTNTNGASTRNSMGGGGALVTTTPDDVTAAASVPSSSILKNVVCAASLTNVDPSGRTAHKASNCARELTALGTPAFASASSKGQVPRCSKQGRLSTVANPREVVRQPSTSAIVRSATKSRTDKDLGTTMYAAYRLPHSLEVHSIEQQEGQVWPRRRHHASDATRSCLACPTIHDVSGGIRL